MSAVVTFAANNVGERVSPHSARNDCARRLVLATAKSPFGKSWVSVSPHENSTHGDMDHGG